MVATSLTLAQTIFTVTALSFLGLGPPPPDPNWGGMLADARQFMELAPLTVVGPAVAIVFATLTFIVLANGLREVLDVGSDAMTAGGTILSVRNLTASIVSRRHTVEAVKGVTFDIGRGEAVGFVGESGCGKSVTARAIMRLAPEGMSSRSWLARSTSTARTSWP